jgi:hemerythrin-like domain-containing protein
MNSTRAARPLRPEVPPLPAFESLDRTHRAAMEMLQAFDRLLEHLDDQGLDGLAQSSAQEIMSFVEGPGRTHHAEEEQHVFPGLLNSSDIDLVQHVRRLQQDHGWIEEDWRELAPQIEAIAKGYNWYDLPMLRAALPIFTALYQDHIALEESLIYPAAKRQLQALQDGGSARAANE